MLRRKILMLQQRENKKEQHKYEIVYKNFAEQHKNEKCKNKFNFYSVATATT